MSGLKHELAPSTIYNQVEERARFEVMRVTRNRKEVNQIAFRLRESGKSWADVLSAVMTLLGALQLAVSPPLCLLPQPDFSGIDRHLMCTLQLAKLQVGSHSLQRFQADLR
jgi:hypothetical protein